MSAKPEAARVPTLTEVLREQVADTDEPEPGAAAAHDQADIDLERLVDTLSVRIAQRLEQGLDDAIAPALAQVSRAVIDLARAEIGQLVREELQTALAEQRRY